MTAPVETWKPYAQLLVRLCPSIGHILFADAGGAPLWSSDPSSASRAQYVLSLLLGPRTTRHREIDGLMETLDSTETRYGFRVRGPVGEVMGLLAFTLPGSNARPGLGEVHALIKPALDCLQGELSDRAAAEAIAGGSVSLEQIAVLANERLSGSVAALLLPDRKLTICRKRPGEPDGIESDVLAQMHRHLMTRAQLHGRTVVANGSPFDDTESAPYKTISAPICNHVQRVIGVLAVFRAAKDRDFERCDAEALELLAREAAQFIRCTFDPLTGLLTNAAFRTRAEAKLAASESRHGLHGMIHVDIDQLNVVNEAHGRHVGDEVIQGVANLLSRRAREGTLVARLGADRFGLFVPACGIEPAARIAEELRSAAIHLSGVRGDKPLAVSLSVGVSRLGEGSQILDEAMATAESACRTAKERGRNRVELFHGGEPGCCADRSAPSFAAQAGAALESDAFELLAQPMLPLDCARADPQFEILLRMRAADGTRLGFEKLTAAAGPDRMRAIDRWVLEQTVERLASSRFRLQQYPAKFSLNLSAASLADSRFWDMLEDLVRKSRLEPGTLGVELPEDAASAHAAAISPYMCRLREHGVTFALDNFGRGTGALAHVNCLPVSCIKIDGRFSRDLVENSKSQSMIMSIAKLAKASGLDTVAVHIETDAIRACAARLGVDYGQGFFIGKPLALDEAIHDLPLYGCFATSTGLFDPSLGRTAASGG